MQEILGAQGRGELAISVELKPFKSVPNDTTTGHDVEVTGGSAEQFAANIDLATELQGGIPGAQWVNMILDGQGQTLPVNDHQAAVDSGELAEH
jgi:hypothetical protein